MNETEYFGRLEFRVSGELGGMRDKELRRWWCDGFIPDRFVVTSKGCHIAGQVWMAKAQESQELWNFVLLLGRCATAREEVQWQELLPADDVTGWLILDFQNRFMKLKPFVAYPDREAD